MDIKTSVESSGVNRIKEKEREFQKLAEPVQPNRLKGSARGLRYKRSSPLFSVVWLLRRAKRRTRRRGLQIFPLDEGLNPLLDDGRIGQDARLQLLGDLCDEAIEIQHPLGFHDPDNGSIDLIFPGFLHFLANLLLLRLRLLLYCRRIYLNLEQVACEIVIDAENIILCDIILHRILTEHIHVRNTSKRPKAPLEIRQRYRSCLLDVLAAQPVC
ncbi:hypothetical protein C4D60_Mb02t09050 [Musa balbisiana]|uniref:Uncharacterized protein n=1 Tax=Musa balbisiana TaxID=52838 RepID=A0A4S8I9C1_MUSBA|nr:hypothetical protein C4D60_Mb02t09050 [Musa balbisiana]